MVGRIAVGLAADGGELPAGARLAGEQALAVVEIHLGVDDVDLDMRDRRRTEFEAGDGLRARLLLLALELGARVAAQRGAGARTVARFDRGEEGLRRRA